MNAKTNTTRQTSSPVPAVLGLNKAFDVGRRAFLRTVVIGAAVLPTASVGSADKAGEARSKHRHFEFSGPGRYLVRDGETRRVFHIERAPWMDCKADGRFYRAIAVNGDAPRRYYTDSGLEDLAIKKLSHSGVSA